MRATTPRLRGLLTFTVLVALGLLVHQLTEYRQHDFWVDLVVFGLVGLLAPLIFLGLDRSVFARQHALQAVLRELEGQMADEVVFPRPHTDLLAIFTRSLGYERAGLYRRSAGSADLTWVGPLPAPPPLSAAQLDTPGWVPEGYNLGIPLEGRTGRMGLVVLQQAELHPPATMLARRVRHQVCHLLAVSIENQWLGRAVIDRQLAEATAEAERQLEHRLHAVIAHQLKTPLMLGQSMLRDAMESLDDPTKVARRLDKVLGSLARFERNVLQHLDRARRHAGPRSLAVRPVRLLEAVQPSLAEVAYAVQKGKLELAVTIPEQVVGLADPARLEIVLDNLISNAVKAMRGAGRLTLTGGREGAHVWLALADKGPGIPPDRLAHLFEEQGPAPGDPTSTGVGLAICRDYVHGMGGTIELAATGPEGTTFRLTLAAGDDVASANLASSAG